MTYTTVEAGLTLALVDVLLAIHTLICRRACAHVFVDPVYARGAMLARDGSAFVNVRTVHTLVNRFVTKVASTYMFELTFRVVTSTVDLITVVLRVKTIVSRDFTVVPAMTRRAVACVVGHEVDARGSVLARSGSALFNVLITVKRTTLFVSEPRGTLARVGVRVYLGRVGAGVETGATISAWLTVALVNVYFAVLACVTSGAMTAVGIKSHGVGLLAVLCAGARFHACA